MLNITERQAADVTILDLDGNVIMGGGSAALGATIRRLLAEGRKKVLLNFQAVKYIDSSGIGELVSGSVAMAREAGQMKLLNLSEKVEEVLSLSSLLSIFEVYKDEREALKHFSSSD